MASTTLTPTRAFRQPRRLDRRAILGIGLGLLTVFGWISFWLSVSDARGVVVATRDLPAGALIGAGDLTVSYVHVDQALYGAAIPAAQEDSLIGQQTSEPVHSQQILARAQISGRPALAAGRVALTVPVSPETAAGGRVRPGDAVLILVTTNKGKPEAKTAVVLPRAMVYDVGYAERTLAVGTGSDSADPTALAGALRSVTLAVTEPEAIAVAQARWSGELDVALLSANQLSAGQPSGGQ